MLESKTNFGYLGASALLNLVLQFFFQLFIINRFGSGSTTDAFFGAFAIPQFVLLVLSTSATLILIPVFSSMNPAQLKCDSWNALWIMLVLLLALSLPIFAWSPQIIQFFLPEADQELTSTLLRIQVISLPFSAMISVQWAYHSARRDFIFVESSSILSYLLIFAILYLVNKRLTITFIAWLSVVRIGIQSLLLFYRWPSIQWPSLDPRLTGDFRKRMQPLVLANIYYKSDVLVDRHLTSMGNAGELTLFNLAQQLYSIGSTLLSKTFVNTAIPNMAVAFKGNDYSTLRSIFRQRFVVLLLITMISWAIWYFAGEYLLAQLGGFLGVSKADARMLYLLLVLLVGYLVGGTIGSLTSSTFYATSDSITPTIITIVIFTLYLPLKFLVFKHYGTLGLAVSVSLYMLLSLFLQLIFLRRKRIA